jgi:hypothetical protein
VSRVGAAASIARTTTAPSAIGSFHRRDVLGAARCRAPAAARRRCGGPDLGADRFAALASLTEVAADVMFTETCVVASVFTLTEADVPATLTEADGAAPCTLTEAVTDPPARAPEAAEEVEASSCETSADAPFKAALVCFSICWVSERPPARAVAGTAKTPTVIAPTRTQTRTSP